MDDTMTSEQINMDDTTSSKPDLNLSIGPLLAYLQPPSFDNIISFERYLANLNETNFPLPPTCEESGEIMDQQHSFNNTENQGIISLKDQAKEVELTKMVDQCHHVVIQQNPSNDPKRELLSGVVTSTGNVQNRLALTEERQQFDNDDNVIIIEEGNETTAMLNNSSDGNLSEQPTQEQAERIAEIEPNEPNEHPTANPIIDSENNEVPNTVLSKSKSAVNISTTPNEPTAPSVGHTVNENTPNCENNEAPMKIEQCRRFSNQQAPLINSMSELRPVLNLLDGTTPYVPIPTSVGSTINENTPNCENNEAPNAILPKTVPSVSISIAPEPIAEMEPNEPNKYLTANTIVDPKNSELPNAVLPKSKPSVNISVDQRFPMNNEAPHAILPKTVPSVSISIAPETHKIIKSLVEIDFAGLLSRKRQLSDNVSNDSVESREKRRLVVNDEQLESRGHCSRDVNHGNLYYPSEALMNVTTLQQNDVHRTPTTAQTLLNIPRDPGPKMKISEIYINTGNGNVSFRTSDGERHYSSHLSRHLRDLRGSEPVEGGCYAHIIIRSPFAIYEKCGVNSGNVIAAQKKFETFSRDVRSISHIWANGNVYAEFGDYSEFSKKALPQSNFCVELFGRNRSILECERLEIKNNSNDWPLSVIMNAARRCKRLILKKMPYQKNELHKEFLEAIYKVKLPQHIDITLQLHYKQSTRDMIEALTERFQRSTGQCFKFTLCSKRIIPHFSNMKNKYGTLKMKKLAPSTFAHLSDWACSNGVLIKQRCFTNVS
ncbi:hypothetical protein Ddc_15340 [Ditylenchus destructor]|nr:hypothetical protein Ddc_15340 [Ditylenchus destructor]